MPLLLYILLIASLSVSAQPQVNLGGDTLICDGFSHTLDAKNPGATYKWSTHQSSQQIQIHQSGEYWVTVTDENGNETVDTIEVVLLNELYNQTDHWLFGNGGKMQFKPASQPQSSAQGFPSSTSSISDPNGNLLFYSDGGTIYESNGSVMLNGENVAGDPGYKANSIIIPRPGSAVYYYVFTLYPEIGLYYSEVNIEANNGKGEVVTKNKILDPYAGDFTAASATDGLNMWLFVHNKFSNVFYSYKLDRNKIIDPKVSETGPVISNTAQIKVTPYGDKMAVTDGENLHLYKVSAGGGQIEHISSTPLPGAYGVEFSRGGNFLYISNGPGGEIFQVDVSPLPTTISLVPFYKSEEPAFFGDLQLGIDGRIYIAENGSNCLPTIDNSNAQEAHMVRPGVCLNEGATSNTDLPIFSQHYFKYPPGLGLRWTDTCQSFGTIISAAYYLDKYPFAKIKYQIDLGDGTVIDTNYRLHTYHQAGSFEITLTVTSVCHTLTRKVTINIDSIPSFTPLVDTTICRGDSVVLDPKVAEQYLPIWSTGASAKTIKVDETGEYLMEIKGSHCSARDTASITVLEYPKTDMPESDFLCAEKEETLTLTPKEGITFYWEHSGETSQSVIASTAGLYIVTATGENGCSVTDTTEIENICEAEIFVPDVFTPNFDFTNDIFIPVGKYVQAYDLRIYDRWGELIFQSDDLEVGWDGSYRGRESQSGAYGVIIIYESKRRRAPNEVKTYKGHLLLAR